MHKCERFLGLVEITDMQRQTTNYLAKLLIKQQVGVSLVWWIILRAGWHTIYKNMNRLIKWQETGKSKQLEKEGKYQKLWQK